MLQVGMRVRVSNPKAKPRYVVLALSKNYVKLLNPYNKSIYKLKRSRIERVNNIQSGE